MSRIQPQTLTNEELLRHVYTMNYNVPVDFVKELHDRCADMLDEIAERDLNID